MKCKNCGKSPSELTEYVNAAKRAQMSPEDFVSQEEGTYNPKTGMFYCTDCYIKIGMPLGKA